MKKITTLTISFICLLFIGAFGQKTEKRQVETFTEISVTSSASVYVKQGSMQKLEVKGDSEDLEDLKTEVRGNRLVIGQKSSGWFNRSNSGKIEVYITMKQLEGVSVSGSGRLYTESKFDPDNLDLSVSGSGRMEIQADCREADMSVSGSGKIMLEGSGKYAEVSISGSGRVKAANFKAEDYKIRISGSGSCEIYATDEIDARISGSGSVYYKGDSPKVNSSTSGSGRIRRM